MSNSVLYGLGQQVNANSFIGKLLALPNFPFQSNREFVHTFTELCKMMSIFSETQL